MSFNQRIQIIIPVLWLGFVLSISFMEAWLKFMAEGVTQTIGLSIGKLVFGVLNKIEFFFISMLIISMFKTRLFSKNKMLRNLLISLFAILLLQTFHLLPTLNLRVNMILKGIEPSASYFHFYYIFLELLKVAGLCIITHQTLMKENE